jgi:ribonuclease G
MKKEIIINATTNELRVAIAEDDRLAEIFLEVPDKERHVGSIYLGRVQRVVQGMNAAFVDIGETQDAFLHFSDVGNAMDEFKDLLDEKDDEDDDEDDEADETPHGEAATPDKSDGRKPRGERRENNRDNKRDKGPGRDRGSQRGGGDRQDRKKPAPAAGKEPSQGPADIVAPEAVNGVEAESEPKQGREERPRDKRRDNRRDDKRRDNNRRDERPRDDRRNRQEPASEDSTGIEGQPAANEHGAEAGGDVDIVSSTSETGGTEGTAEAGAEERRQRRNRRGRRGRGGKGNRRENEHDDSRVASEHGPAQPADSAEPEMPAATETEGSAATENGPRRDKHRGGRGRGRDRGRDRRRGNNPEDQPASEQLPMEMNAPPAAAESAPADSSAPEKPERRDRSRGGNRRQDGRSSRGENPGAQESDNSERQSSEKQPSERERPERERPEGERSERERSGRDRSERERSERGASQRPPSEKQPSDREPSDNESPRTEAGDTPQDASQPGKEGRNNRRRPQSRRGGRRNNSDRRNNNGGPPPSGSGTMDAKLPTFQTKRSGEVTIGLEKGQDVIVQVTRESYASKGVRVSTKIGLPGRFLVLLPLDGSVGISRKVQNMKERRRLRRIAKGILPEGYGCIIRTVAQDKDEEVIRQDLLKLIDTWRTIEQKLKQVEGPSLLYKDQSVANTVMRDLFTPDTTRVIIDNKVIHREIRDYVEWAAPGLADKVELYTGNKPIFDEFGVEKELEKMFQRKIYIPSGGYIIMEQTEAMMVIDVNSGRYAGNKEQELNALRTNLESAREIARQIRLRDIGGLIIVDFIDLYDEKNRKKVYDELKKDMKRDRAKSVVLPMTQFGLVQMTRQRIRQQILQTISEPCPTCSGSGFVQSKSTVMRRIERWLKNFKEGSREFRLTLSAHPTIIDYLTEGHVSRLTKLMLKYFVRVKIVPDESLGVDEFHFYSIRQQSDITDKYMKE